MSMNVAISINEKFSRYGYVMLSSLFRHHMDEEIKVYVLYRLLSEQRKKEMEELASQYKGKEILFVQITVEDIPFRLPSTEKWPVEVYFRLLLPFFASAGRENLILGYGYRNTRFPSFFISVTF